MTSQKRYKFNLSRPSASIAGLPPKPGIYIVKRGNDVLYIGKAQRSIRDRWGDRFKAEEGTSDYRMRNELFQATGGRPIYIETIEYDVKAWPYKGRRDKMIKEICHREGVLIEKHWNDRSMGKRTLLNRCKEGMAIDPVLSFVDKIWEFGNSMLQGGLVVVLALLGWVLWRMLNP